MVLLMTSGLNTVIGFDGFVNSCWPVVEVKLSSRQYCIFYVCDIINVVSLLFI